MPCRRYPAFVAALGLLHVVVTHAEVTHAEVKHAEVDGAPESAIASTVTAYPAGFFAASRVISAFDMLALLPGYRFADGDTAMRGLADAAGNVLIDGSRPASKHESLEAILRRIPVAAVERIELIRAGTPGVDMQGHSVLANVVRTADVSTRGSITVGDAFYARGLSAPLIAAELAHRSGERLLELSGSAGRTVDDEHGAGSRPRLSSAGQVLRDGGYSQDETERTAAVRVGYEMPTFGGNVRLHGSMQRAHLRADILDERTFPTTITSTVTEFETQDSLELGVRLERPFIARTRLEVAAIRRDLRERGGERSQDPQSASSFREDSEAAETAVRVLLRRSDGPLALEGGVEFALNSLDTRTGLIEDDVVSPLPNAGVRVEERRGEAIFNATWTMNGAWSASAGARFEYSTLRQSGDTELSKHLFFPKPRVLLNWSRGPDQLHLVVERTVGQLDFEDFAGSASLATGTVTAGNLDLEPDRIWRAELAWERRFLGNGAVSIAVRHEKIDDLIDRMPVVADTVFDTIGNIGTGIRNELEINSAVPLDRLGLSAGVLKVAALWRHGETTDPVTGRTRGISEDEPLVAELHFLQPVPRWKLRWGIDLTLPVEEREYRFDEVRTDRLGSMLNVFVECEPAASWTVRLFLNNLTDRASVRRREVYESLRSEAPVRYIETRTLAIERYAGFEVARRFGE